MAGKYRRYYLGAGATLLTLFLALQLYGLQIKDLTGDIYCDDVCTSYFDVVNPTYRSIYIYNKESIDLDFSPEIKDYTLYIKYYGKWREMDFTMDTRLPNVPKSRKYVFVFPRYATKHFKLVGTKEVRDTVKWTFGMPGSELDPLWIGKKPIDCKNVTTFWNESVPVYGEVEVNFTCTWALINYTTKPKEAFCWKYSPANVTSPSEYYLMYKHKYSHLDIQDQIIFWDEERIIGYKTVIHNKTKCEKTGYINDSGDIIAYEGFWCELCTKKIATCVNFKDGGVYNIKPYEDEEGEETCCNPDGSVTCWEENLETKKTKFYNSMHIKLKKKGVSLNEVS